VPAVPHGILETEGFNGYLAYFARGYDYRAAVGKVLHGCGFGGFGGRLGPTTGFDDVLVGLSGIGHRERSKRVEYALDGRSVY